MQNFRALGAAVFIVGLLAFSAGGTPSPSGGALSGGFVYANECVTNVDNATIHFSGDREAVLPGGTPVETGDTIAVYNGSVCGGYAVWTEQGATMAAAGSDDIEVSDDAFAPGDSLRFEVHDVSEDTVYRPAVHYASCEDSSIPICAEGAYEDGTFHEISYISPDTIGRSVQLAGGWNFLSVPVANDRAFNQMFSECFSAYVYDPDGGYTALGESETVPSEKGVAVKCPSGATIQVYGSQPSVSASAGEGWNLVGSVPDTVSADSVMTEPTGILSSDFFRFINGQGYETADWLEPGDGHWIKTEEPGTIDLTDPN